MSKKVSKKKVTKKASKKKASKKVTKKAPAKKPAKKVKKTLTKKPDLKALQALRPDAPVESSESMADIAREQGASESEDEQDDEFH